MQVLVAIQRYPVLAAGLVIAAIAGVVLGGAAHPDLSGPGIGGPRMLVPFGGARAEATATGGGGWSGSSAVAPDYVLGTDWTHPKVAAVSVADSVELYEPEAMPTDEPTWPGASEVGTWEEPRAPPRYPSIVGNATYAEDGAGPAPDDDPLLDD